MPSPYSTGGGGVVFHHRVYARYLALLLTGDTASELDGRVVESVAFEQAHKGSTHDLVLRARREDSPSVDLELWGGVRRTPNFTRSHEKTKTLVQEFMGVLQSPTPKGVERRLLLCVSGATNTNQSAQVRQLTAIAREQLDPDKFFDLVRTPGTFQEPLRRRLEHIEGLVEANLSSFGRSPATDEVRRLTWKLLSKLYVLMLRLETPDEQDWDELANRLRPWVRESTIAGGEALRNRLASLADQYAPLSAQVDLANLRRDAHNQINPNQHRNETPWAELLRLDQEARDTVHTSIGAGVTSNPLSLPRGEAAAALRECIETSECLLVSGESGVGKSALVVSELSPDRVADDREVIYLNLRLLPPTTAELRTHLGAPLEHLLAEMSAPTRIFVIDSAESNADLLSALIGVARRSDVMPLVVTTTDGVADVRKAIGSMFQSVVEYQVESLTDEDLNLVGERFPPLRRMVDDPRGKELLRRPVIVDLFVRSEVASELPLSDADTLEVVWKKLVRSNRHQDRGMPAARESTFLRLAQQCLQPEDQMRVFGSLDTTAVGGLQSDGLLRSSGNIRQILPDFAHDVLRTYAIAKLLLSKDDPVGAFVEYGAPRGCLPAVRLVAQALLSASNERQPAENMFVYVQTEFDRLTQEGSRWSDLPSEAVLDLPNSHALLEDAWPSLLHQNGVGLGRLLRIIHQRGTRSGPMSNRIGEPLVALLLNKGWPEKLDGGVDELIRSWLSTLVLAGTPAGNPLRRDIRERIVSTAASSEPHPRQTNLKAINEGALVELALLGADMGSEGEDILRRLATDTPEQLAPALEHPFAGLGIASYNPSLLTELAGVYYLDDRNSRAQAAVFSHATMRYQDHHGHDRNFGIRPHLHMPEMPLAAWYRGPFFAMFQRDFENGVACVNRLLNHAAKRRTQAMIAKYEAYDRDEIFGLDLAIGENQRRYVGDAITWRWYRGTEGGPPPCMSALQALERVLDQKIEAGVAVSTLVSTLLNGCENLAMVGLIVGFLIRNLDRVEDDLDPFLGVPEVWDADLRRALAEHHPVQERYRDPDEKQYGWRLLRLKEVAAMLVMRAAGERVETLRSIGQQLVKRVEQREDQIGDTGDPNQPISEVLAAAISWSKSLDKDAYEISEAPDGRVITELKTDDGEFLLGELIVNPVGAAELSQVRFRHTATGPPVAVYSSRSVSAKELLEDINTVREIWQSAPNVNTRHLPFAVAAVAAAALERNYVLNTPVPFEDLLWAAESLIHITSGLGIEDSSDVPLWEHEVLGQDCARGVPLLWLPTATDLRRELASKGTTEKAINEAVGRLIDVGHLEVQYFLIRALDPLWSAPCYQVEGICRHLLALEVSKECAQPPTGELIEEDETWLPSNAGSPFVLCAPIRAATGAWLSSPCCRDQAETLLLSWLTDYQRNMDSCDMDLLHMAEDVVVPRALVDIAANGQPFLLMGHVAKVVGHGRALSGFLRSLALVGYETPVRAAALRDIWPKIMHKAFEVLDAGDEAISCPYEEGDLAALLPLRLNESDFWTREIAERPVAWFDTKTLAREVDRWVAYVGGNSAAVDSLLLFLGDDPSLEDVHFGLRWLDEIIAPDPQSIANRTTYLCDWLKGVGEYALDTVHSEVWLRIVDTMTVADDQRISQLAN